MWAKMRQTMQATVSARVRAVKSFTPFLSSTRPTIMLKNAPGRQPMVEIAASSPSSMLNLESVSSARTAKIMLE